MQSTLRPESEVTSNLEQLRESEARFRSMVELSPEAIVVHANERFIYANKAAAHLLGLSQVEDLLSRSIWDFAYPEDVEKLEHRLEENGWNEFAPIESRLLRADGQVLDIESTSVETVYWGQAARQVFLRDITQRKRSENALRESEERYRLLVESSPEALYVYLDQKFVYVNEAGVKLLGAKRPEDLLGKPIWAFIHSESLGLIRKQAWEIGQGIDDPDLIEVKMVGLDGRICSVESAGTTIIYKGQPARQVFVRDITQRKKAEEALYHSMATNRALLEAIPDLMVRIRADGTFVNYKEARGTSLSLVLPAAELIGKKIHEVLSPEIATIAQTCIDQALQTGEVQTFEYQLWVNGQLGDFEVRIVASAEDEVLAIVRDITQRKQAERDIRAALAKERELSELRSRFVNTTSHEFRTPLSIILSSAELLEMYGEKWTKEKKSQHFQRVYASIRRMIDLLNDVLMVGKGDAGQLKLNLELFNLSELCQVLLTEYQMDFASNHLLKFACYGQPVKSYLDEKFIRQVLTNLLSNAVKYSPINSQIDVAVKYKPDKLILVVADQGLGIPVADRSQLFEPFHRGSNVESISGTGLGLNIVKKAVELHKGEITVESTVGTGTTFRVTLPLLLLKGTF